MGSLEGRGVDIGLSRYLQWKSWLADELSTARRSKSRKAQEPSRTCKGDAGCGWLLLLPRYAPLYSVKKGLPGAECRIKPPSLRSMQRQTLSSSAQGLNIVVDTVYETSALQRTVHNVAPKEEVNLTRQSNHRGRSNRISMGDLGGQKES